MNKIRYVFVKSLSLILELLLSIFIKRSKNILIVGQNMFGKSDVFMHNVKYLLLRSSLYLDTKIVFLCDDSFMREKLSSIGFYSFSRSSLKGIYYLFKAKYSLFDFSSEFVNHYFLKTAVNVNLWHGIPLKKIHCDDENNFYAKMSKLTRFIYDILNPVSKYYVVNSQYEQSCYETAFLTKKENIKILGSPRLDVLFNDIPHSDLFMEEDFKNIQKLKEQGKKLFFYTPTFRDTGKDISSWLKSEKLKEFLNKNNAILVCKLHFADKNSLDFELTEEFYKMDSNSDIYPVLKYSDALITDYSSIYFDYLLLDKPILYYVPDIEEYQEKCRGFYRPYEELTAGTITKTEEELKCN